MQQLRNSKTTNTNTRRPSQWHCCCYRLLSLVNLQFQNARSPTNATPENLFVNWRTRPTIIPKWHSRLSGSITVDAFQENWERTPQTPRRIQRSVTKKQTDVDRRRERDNNDDIGTDRGMEFFVSNETFPCSPPAPPPTVYQSALGRSVALEAPVTGKGRTTDRPLDGAAVN